MAQVTLVRTREGKMGGGSYLHAGTRAKVVVGRKLFVDGKAPETLVLELPDELLAPDNPKFASRPVIQDTDKLAKAQERVARAQERAAKAAEKAAKLAERATSLATRIAEM